MDQWSLYIDIEGFSSTYEKDTQAVVSLGALMEAIYKVGSTCYPESPHRLYAHQLGDGFVVVGEFGWTTLEQPVTLAIILLRAVLQAGGVAKGAISEGRFADIVGCYPKMIQDVYARSCGGAFPLGAGLMTILPVMGTALINSYALLHEAATPSGPLLILRRSGAERLPSWVNATPTDNVVAVDWIHSTSASLEATTRMAGLAPADPAGMIARLRDYMKTSAVPPQWRENAERYLHMWERLRIPTRSDWKGWLLLTGAVLCSLVAVAGLVGVVVVWTLAFSHIDDKPWAEEYLGSKAGLDLMKEALWAGLSVWLWRKFLRRGRQEGPRISPPST